MATYVIGDVQGCFQPLLALLNAINFRPGVDKIWFVGDLVNRGPESLAVLRFVKNLGENQVTVLGNHDLHLLAVAAHVREKSPNDTLDAVLAAQDKDELLNWLASCPLLHYDEAIQTVMTHAGIAPHWTLSEAQSNAYDVEQIIKTRRPDQLKELFGNHPNQWHPDLTGAARNRCIINYFTRMRYCYRDASLAFDFKGKISDKPPELVPWYELKKRIDPQLKIYFGHWAALQGQVPIKNMSAVDTGCVWGRALTAECIEDGSRFQVDCQSFKKHQ